MRPTAGYGKFRPVLVKRRSVTRRSGLYWYIHYIPKGKSVQVLEGLTVRDSGRINAQLQCSFKVSPGLYQADVFPISVPPPVCEG